MSKISLFSSHATINEINKLLYASFVSAADQSYIKEYAQFINLYKISELVELDEEFIENHIAQVNINSICENKLSERFIEKHSSILNWCKISIHSELSCEFMEANSNLISWDLVSYYQKIEKWFFDKYKDKLNLNSVINSPFVDEELKSYYTEYFINYYMSLR